MDISGDDPTLHHEAFETILTYMKAGINPLLVGPAGCGKTTLARKIAEKLGVKFYYTGAVESAFQLKGFVDAHGRVVETSFVKAYRDGGVFLFDEMDGSDPNALLAAHAALDNGVLDTPGGMITMNPNLYFIGAANTWGHGATLDYMGRNHLDSATLDRFVIFPMDYDAKLEREIIDKHYPEHKDWPDIVQRARAAARELSLHHVISTRAIVKGAALLKTGSAKADVINNVLMSNLANDTKIKLLEAIKKAIPLAAEIQKSIRETAKLTTEIADRMAEFAKLRNEIVEVGGKAQTAIQDGRKLVTSALDLTGRLEGLRGVMQTLDTASRPLIDAAQAGIDAMRESSPAPA